MKKATEKTTRKPVRRARPAPATTRRAGSKSAAAVRKSDAAGVPRGDARRKLILRALHTCVLDRGYSKTSLADVAQEAGMYPSHLLYYFDGKEAILEQYFQDVSLKILNRLESFEHESVERQIELLANLFFASEGIKKSEIGFMLECFGVAVNDQVLRQEKSELDRQCKQYLVKLFEQTPARNMKEPKDCAEVAYSMLIGLRSAVYFDETLSLPDAYRLFSTAVRNLAGLD